MKHEIEHSTDEIIRTGKDFASAAAWSVLLIPVGFLVALVIVEVFY